MTAEPKPAAPQRRGMSGTAKILLGCGCATVLGVLVCAGVIGGGTWYALQMTNSFAEQFESQGYRRVTAQQVTESEPIAEPTVFMAQHVVIQEGAQADVAIAAQVAELHGTFDGDIDFFGQLLQIKSDAVIEGDVRIKGGQVITVDGVVVGEISGSYQALDDRNRKPADEEGPEQVQQSDEPQ